MYNEPGSRKPIRNKDGSVTHFDKDGNTYTQKSGGNVVRGYAKRGGGSELFDKNGYAGRVDRTKGGNYVHHNREGKVVGLSNLQADGTYHTVMDEDIKKNVEFLNHFLGFRRRERKQAARDKAKLDAHYAQKAKEFQAKLREPLAARGTPASPVSSSATPASNISKNVQGRGVLAFVLGLSNIIFAASLIVPILTVLVSVDALRKFNPAVHAKRWPAGAGLLLGLAALTFDFLVYHGSYFH